jgi:Leucine-rich repeat (LRR) protein
MFIKRAIINSKSSGIFLLLFALWFVTITATTHAASYTQIEDTLDAPMMAPADCGLVVGMSTAECNALVSLYTSTDGTNWETNTNWDNDNTPCGWYGVTCNLGSLTQLSLSSNQLNGTIPDLSALTSMTTLDLSYNQLSGDVPLTFASLTGLSSLDISYNALTATIPAVETFLDGKQSGWDDTQTVPVTGLAVRGPRATSVILDWTAILYTGDGGYYEISYADDLGGPWTVHGNTTDKTATTYTVTSIDTSVTAFRVRTYTPAHGIQDSELWSADATTSYDPDTYYGIPVAEYEALRALYNSTNGLGWFYNGGWLQDETPCGWERVWCSSGHVRTLQLFVNNLSGTLPDLSALTDLEYLYLNSNNLVGSIPNLSALTNLQLLYLNDNGLTGNAPDLSALTALTDVQLDDNQLTGNMPDISGLSNLINFTAENNQLDGTLSSLAGLTSLQYLYLTNNQLTGLLPDLSGLTSLKYLKLGDNLLSGNVPTAFLPPNVWTFDLSNNNFDGALPDVSGLISLRTLLLGENQFTGTIANLSGLTNLRQLYLHDNSLTGGIPNMPPSMENLRLQNNRLGGSIPTLGGMANLQYLWLENNQFSGVVPSSLAALSSLFSVRVDYNALVALDGAVIAVLNSLNPGWDLTQTVPVTNFEVWDFTQTSAELTWAPIHYTADGGFYEVSFATNPGGPWTVDGVTTDKTASGYSISDMETNTVYYLRVRTYTPLHGLQQNNLWSDYSVAVTYDVGWAWITEGELFEEMQRQIITNPAIQNIEVAVVDFTTGLLNFTIRVPDGTLVNAILSIDDVGPFAVAQFTSITVAGIDAAIAYRDIAYLELTPLVMNSLHVLFEQKVGAGRDLERIAVLDTMIEAAFLP